MAIDLPEPVRKILKEAGYPDPMWYVGSAEGTWNTGTVADWAHRRQKSEPDAPQPPVQHED